MEMIYSSMLNDIVRDCVHACQFFVIVWYPDPWTSRSTDYITHYVLGGWEGGPGGKQRYIIFTGI